jgi:hypothetical protein
MKNPFSMPRPVPDGPWRWLVPVLLVLLFLLVLLWLPWQARQMESNERQEQLIADTLWVEQTQPCRRAWRRCSRMATSCAASPGSMPTAG